MAEIIAVCSGRPRRPIWVRPVARIDGFLLRAIGEEHGGYCVNAQLCGFEGGKGFVGGRMPFEERPDEIRRIQRRAWIVAPAAAGLPAYEISNHAAPGAESRHNLTYWRYGDYAGIGPGAHGRLTLDGQRVGTQRVRHEPLRGEIRGVRATLAG